MGQLDPIRGGGLVTRRGLLPVGYSGLLRPCTGTAIAPPYTTAPL